MNCYIHVPFCRKKCGYCAFYSEESPEPALFDRYLTKLAADLQSDAPGGKVYDTLYVGGGTPTLWQIEYLEKFIALLHKHLRFAPGAELSIEANPETLDAAKISLLRENFTRLSLGVQSFDPQLRQSIGRVCSQEKLLHTLKLIKAAAFPHFNCDLIYALPGESAAVWQQDLLQAVDAGVDHLSCYALTAEEGSSMGWQLQEDDERAVDFFHQATEVLSACDIERYEISNYARNGGQCRHNTNVWRGEELTAFGPAGAGFDGNCRYVNAFPLDRWLAGSAAESDPLPTNQRLNEIFAVNLRTTAGWTPALWAQVKFADSWQKRLNLAAECAALFPGCFHIAQQEIHLTTDGLLFWNDIAAALI
ncbi:MAG: radical SAM family heme chaperone HemW [Lentisphaeria bacterium]|nr:radical SAM family heme chaperone HemW [Lentisphaeria bacterium]